MFRGVLVVLLQVILSTAEEGRVQEESSRPCWFDMFVHLAKTGGSYRRQLETMGISATQVKFITRPEELFELTLAPLPSPEEPENRRLSIEIAGYIHHDGCLLSLHTIPWAQRVAEKYRQAGCQSVVHTIFREPISHFISTFRQWYFGRRKKDIRPLLSSKRVHMHNLQFWALKVLASAQPLQRQQSVRLSTADSLFLQQAEEFLTEAKESFKNVSYYQDDATRDWSHLNKDERYLFFTLMLAQHGVEYKYQSNRLLPIQHRRARPYPRLQKDHQYDPIKSCNASLWNDPYTTFTRIRTSFDLIGLTELRAAYLVQLVSALGEIVPNDLYKSDCDIITNPAYVDDTIEEDLTIRTQTNQRRHLLLRTTTARERNNDRAWAKRYLPPTTVKLLHVLLKHDMQLYKLIRDEFWCKIPGVPDTVASVIKTCMHPWHFDTYKCPPSNPPSA